MKRILVTIPALLVALTMSGCASMLRSALGTSSGGSYNSSAAYDDQTAQHTQEDVQRMSDWLNQQQVQATQDQANQMAAQASMDASNAAAASAAAAAASVPPVNP